MSWGERVGARIALLVVLLSTAVLPGSETALGAEPPAAGVLPTGPSVPAAETFRSIRSYQEVAPPVRLRIAAAGVDTPLTPLGRAADQTIEVPTDYGVAGWFAEGPRPGQAGPAVILGHLDSERGPAVFAALPALPAGAEIMVDRADGSTLSFRVTETHRVPKSQFPTDLVYGASLQPSLRLVTCGGQFDRATGHYRDNVIVYADPVR